MTENAMKWSDDQKIELRDRAKEIVHEQNNSPKAELASRRERFAAEASNVRKRMVEREAILQAMTERLDVQHHTVIDGMALENSGLSATIEAHIEDLKERSKEITERINERKAGHKVKMADLKAAADADMESMTAELKMLEAALAAVAEEVG